MPGLGLALRRLLIAPYVNLGTIFDGWYERMPWRRAIPPGQRGEQLAARYLRRSGYLILARNFWASGTEIDLVALDRDRLVFIEVKARWGEGFGRPQDAVDEAKRDSIRSAAEAYAEWRGITGLAVRFDVVAINATRRRFQITLIKDAF